MNVLLDRLSKGPVLCAEGYLFELERRGYLKAGAFVPEAVLDNPQVVKEVHRDFVRAGTDVIVAFTYYAHRDKLKTIGREADLEKMNKDALRMAHEVKEEEGSDALIAGNICNTWVYNPEDRKTHAEVQKMFEEQVGWAKSAGVDFIIAETIDYLGEALIALDEIKKAGLPAVITLAPHSDKTTDGYKIEYACKILEDSGADVVGLNCFRGHNTMLPQLKRIRTVVDGHVAALPVPYHTTQEEPTFQVLGRKQAFPTNLDSFTCSREDMAGFAKEAHKMGINYIGICCGAGAHHVRAMAEALGKETPASVYSPDMSQHGTQVKKKP